MMAGVSPETRRASYKYGIIKFGYIVASCWMFFMNCTMMHGSTNIQILIQKTRELHNEDVMDTLYFNAAPFKVEVLVAGSGMFVRPGHTERMCVVRQ